MLRCEGLSVCYIVISQDWSCFKGPWQGVFADAVILNILSACSFARSELLIEGHPTWITISPLNRNFLLLLLGSWDLVRPSPYIDLGRRWRRLRLRLRLERVRCPWIRRNGRSCQQTDQSRYRWGKLQNRRRRNSSLLCRHGSGLVMEPRLTTMNVMLGYVIVVLVFIFLGMHYISYYVNIVYVINLAARARKYDTNIA